MLNAYPLLKTCIKKHSGKISYQGKLKIQNTHAQYIFKFDILVFTV